MDPHLEHPGRWPDVHHRLISVASNLLRVQLRPKYYIRIEERVYLSDESDPGRSVIIPDMRIVTRAERSNQPARSSEPVAVATVEPVLATTLFEEEIREARLEVIDRELRTVVTVIEVLSPTNKVRGSRGQASYLEKRADVMRSPSHLVEIDLLRAGEPMEVQESLPAHDYLIHVSKVADRPKGLVWSIPISNPLPQIEIPLRPEDPPALLNLQEAVNLVYEEGDYDLDIDYRAEPVPPLSPKQAEWANRLLKSKGLR
jgi:hypothetical protein